jgi:DNA repair photolyase
LIIKRIKIKQALNKSGLPDLDYALNPYVGCAHACIYCYARAYTRYKEVASNWGQMIYIKDNLIEVLTREVKRLKKGIVGVSTITDPYQPIEEKERITRNALQILLDSGFQVSIQTKSPLVIRDVDILTRYIDKVDIGFTITTLRDDIAKIIEPNAPLPRERARALSKLADKELNIWLFLGPIIPGVNDGKEQIEEIIEFAKNIDARLYYDFLRLKPEVIVSLRTYVAKGILSSEAIEKSRNIKWRHELKKLITNLCARVDLECQYAFQSDKKPIDKKTLDNFFTNSI